MAQAAYSLPTRLGLSKQARALAQGEEIVFTHIAIGDGDRYPTGAETALLNEVARFPISGNGVVSGTIDEAFFEIFLDAAKGPYTIREAALVDEDGTLHAITREDPPIQKVLPQAGRVHEFVYRLQTVLSALENVVVRVDGSTVYVPAERQIQTKPGSGLTGGGTLGADRELKVDFATPTQTAAGQIPDKAVTPEGVKAAMEAAVLPLYFHT